MKVLLICLLSFLLMPFNFEKTPEQKAKDDFLETNPASQTYQEFVIENRNIYNKTTEYKFINNDKYTFSLFYSFYDNECYFDVFLYTYEPNTYTIRIIIDGIEYRVQDILENGNITAHLIKCGKENTKVYVYNGLSRKEVILPNSFDEIDNSKILVGYNNGGVTSFLEPIEGLNRTMLIILVTMIFIICLCCMALALLFIFKVGRFSKRANVVTFEENQNEEPINNENKDYVIDYANYYQESVENKEEQIEPIKKDIKELLENRGYKTDYSEMTEDEKNEVMVYFMILRNNNEISSEQYQEEVVRLWKK